MTQANMKEPEVDVQPSDHFLVLLDVPFRYESAPTPTRATPSCSPSGPVAVGSTPRSAPSPSPTCPPGVPTSTCWGAARTPRCPPRPAGCCATGCGRPSPARRPFSRSARGSSCSAARSPTRRAGSSRASSSSTSTPSQDPGAPSVRSSRRRRSPPRASSPASRTTVGRRRSARECGPGGPDPRNRQRHLPGRSSERGGPQRARRRDLPARSGPGPQPRIGRSPAETGHRPGPAHARAARPGTAPPRLPGPPDRCTAGRMAAGRPDPRTEALPAAEAVAGRSAVRHLTPTSSRRATVGRARR